MDDAREGLDDTTEDLRAAVVLCPERLRNGFTRIRADLQRLENIDSRLAKMESDPEIAELRVEVRELIRQGHAVLVATATHAARSAVGAALPRPPVKMVREAGAKEVWDTFKLMAEN